MKKSLGFIAILFFAFTTAFAQIDNNVDKNGVIIDGYDAVEFFNSGKAVKGKSTYALKYEGAVYHFSTEKNKKAFKENPKKYKVQYGGWCAYAIAKGSKAKIDINTGTVIDGKLYFNYDQRIQKKFDKDRTGYIKKADKNWENLKTK